MVLQSPEEQAGTVTACPRCRQPLRVPGPVATPTSTAAQVRSETAVPPVPLPPAPPSASSGKPGPVPAVPLWKRILRETWLVGWETASLPVRPIRHLWNHLRRRSLRRKVHSARLTFGQHLYEARAGDPEVREQIHSLGERILAAEADQATARKWTARRRELLCRLGDPYLDRESPPPAGQEVHGQARAARASLQALDRKMQVAGAGLLPPGKTGWRRAGIGCGLAACAVAGVFLFLHPRPAVPPPEETGKDSPKELTTREIYARYAPAVGLIRGEKILAGGTGFLARPNLLVTNAHVVDGLLLSDLRVYFPSAPDAGKKPLTAELVYFDPRRDLAVLEVKSALEPLRVAGQYDFKPGEDVTVIGSPNVGKLILENFVSRGVMSNVRKVREHEFYVLDVTINPGNSGGPVFDSTGQVIGVVTLKARKQERIALCVPAEDVNKALAVVERQSPRERKEASARHGLLTLFRRIAITGALYHEGTRVCLSYMVRGVPPRVAMGRVKGVIQKKLQESGLGTFDEINSAVAAVDSNPNVPDETRRGLAELWKTCTEMRQLFDDPGRLFRGNPTARIRALGDRYQKQVEALAGLLGVKELD
jgi:S1-C subfamily serine protease